MTQKRPDKKMLPRGGVRRIFGIDFSYKGGLAKKDERIILVM